MATYYPADVFPQMRRGDIQFDLFARTSPLAHPFPQPRELQGILSEQDWQERTVALWKHFSRWSWSQAERVLITVALVLSGAVPILTSILVNHFEFKGLQPLPDDATDQDIAARVQVIRTAHAITGGIILGFFLLVWVPYFVYKSAGTRRLRNLLASYNAQDAARGNMQALRWNVFRTSTFNRSASVIVSLPVALVSASQPSLFTSGAYLPSYIRKDPDAVPSYPGGAPVQGAGLPPQQSQFAPPAGPPPARESYEDEMLRMGMERSKQDEAVGMKV
jgi:hypothetical protein